MTRAQAPLLVGVNVLLVEDDEQVATVLSTLLTAHGADARAATCGASALDAVRADPYWRRPKPYGRRTQFPSKVRLAGRAMAIFDGFVTQSKTLAPSLCQDRGIFGAHSKNGMLWGGRMQAPE